MTSHRSTDLKVIIVTQLLFLYTQTSSLGYKDLEDLEISCPPADTCAGRVPADTVESRSCDCGPSCTRHRTCCIDSPYKDVKLSRNLEECTWVESINKNVFMISKCNPLWDGPERTKEICEGGIKSLNDPVSIIPVTSTVSGLHYANFFCAMCNKEDDHIPWNFILTREERWGENPRMCAGILPRFVEYTDVTGELGWGYWHEYTTNRKKFISLKVQIEIPHVFRALVSECFRDSVSECAKDWDDEDVKRKCESYTAVIEVPLEDEDGYFLGNRTYRNIHCALCNRAKNLRKASCKLLGEARDKAFPANDISILSFPYNVPNLECMLHIADIKPNAYLKDCRTVVCDPGYEIQKGRCIPKGMV